MRILRNGETAYYALSGEGKEPVELSYSLSATNVDGESLNKEGNCTGIYPESFMKSLIHLPVGLSYCVRSSFVL